MYLRQTLTAAQHKASGAQSQAAWRITEGETDGAQTACSAFGGCNVGGEIKQHQVDVPTPFACDSTVEPAKNNADDNAGNHDA